MSYLGVPTLAPMAALQGMWEGLGGSPGPQDHPTVGAPWGVSIELSSASLGVWTLAGPTAWQHQALAAQ